MSLKEDVLSLNTKAQRNLSLQDLKEWYSEEELSKLFYKTYDENRKEMPNDARFLAFFEELKASQKKANKIFRWTPKEDEFLKSNYMFLSDATIGLALNLPSYVITSRRSTLNLIKGHTTPIEVMVWCKRDDFEADLKKGTLTKARPDIREAIEQPNG